MATTVKKNKEPKKGSIEDAAKILKQSKESKDNADDDNAGKESNVIPLGSPAPGDTQPPGEGDQAMPTEESGSIDNNQLGEDVAPSGPDFPIPTAKQIQDSAEMLAKNPDLLEAFKNTIAVAEQIIADRDQPVKLTADELKAENHARIVATYGKDFVTAKKGNNKGYYSRKSWNQMGKNKMGWTEVTEVMPEVAQAATDAAQ